MANRFNEKFSPVSLSKRVVCVDSITAIANIDCKYMKFCARDIYGSYVLAPKDLFLEPTLKIQWICLHPNFNIFLIYVTMRAILPLK